MAPDEFIFITALKCWGYVRSMRRVDLQPGMRFRPGTLLNSYPTFVVFPAESSPHPVLWTQLEGKVTCQVRLSCQAAGAFATAWRALYFILCSDQAATNPPWLWAAKAWPGDMQQMLTA
jgi:hypothetical protein